MGKIAFVFAGQGAQYSGMGKDFYASNAAARAVFDEAEALRPGTLAQCFESDEAVLKETKNTQPDMFAVELATAAALTASGIRADMTAGFSLGELAALAYAGAGSFAEIFQLVTKRGALMQQAAEKQPTAMVAALKLSAEDVEKLCAEFANVYPVNFNCPGQVSCSGLAEEIKAFSAAVKEAGGRAVPLKVKGGFHSPFMKEAAAAFDKELAAVDFKTLEIPVYANCNGLPYSEDVVTTLSQQMANPVRWETSVRNMIAAGCDTFIEIGPGDTLSGMIKRIDGNVRRYTCGSIEEMNKILEEVKA